MNYYLELLESYSKLKKRSLTLIAEEGGEAEREPLTSVDAVIQQYGMMTPDKKGQSFPHPSPAPGHEKLHLTRTDFSLKARFAKRNSAIVKQTSNPARTAKEGLGWVSIEGQNGLYKNTIIAAELEEWLNLKNPDANAGDANAIAAENEAREQAEVELRELNKTTLAPIVVDIGYPTINQPNTPAQAKFAEGYDFFVDDQVSRNAFIEHLEGFVNKLIDDVTIPLQLKIDSLNNLKDLVWTATRVKNQKEGVVDLNLGSALKDIKEKIAMTHRGGEIALTQEPVFDEFDPETRISDEILLIGREAVKINGEDRLSAKYGRAVPAFTELKKTITRGIQKHNLPIEKLNKDSDSLIRTSWERADVKRGGTPGEDAVRRCDIDEGLVTAAGIIHSLGALSDRRSDADRKRGQPHTHQIQIDFLKKQLQNSVDSILGEDTVMGAAAYLRSGLDQVEDLIEQKLLVRTLLNAAQSDYANALIDRLVNDVKMTRDEAKNFLKNISDDGRKVLGLSLLFRYNTVKNIFGEVKPLYAVGVGNRGERIRGRKVDNAFVFSPDDADALLAQLNAKTGLNKKSIDGYTEKGTIASFINRGILKASDFPDKHDLEQEVLLHRFSLKTHNDDNSDSSQGSAAVSTIVPFEVTEEKVKGADGGDIDNPEFKFREQVRQSVEDVTSEDDQKELYSFLEGCKPDLYKDGTPIGKPKEQTIKFWKLVGVKIANLKGTKLENFQKSLATYLLVLGGGSRANQLNVISYSDTGNFTAQDDHTFRADVVEKLKNKDWKLNYSLNAKTGGIITIGPKIKVERQVRKDGKKVWEKDEEGKFKKDKNGKKVPKMKKVEVLRPMLKVNGKGLRTDVWKSAEYLQGLAVWRDTGVPPIMGQENSSTMLRQFLSAQAKMIQELLATE